MLRDSSKRNYLNDQKIKIDLEEKSNNRTNQKKTDLEEKTNNQKNILNLYVLIYLNLNIKIYYLL